MEEYQIAILKIPKVTKYDGVHTMWESGCGVIAQRVGNDSYLINHMGDGRLYCTVFKRSIKILKWHNKWKQIR